eukprot:11025312-Lingulodinium_polyedra.AAC.1
MAEAAGAEDDVPGGAMTPSIKDRTGNSAFGAVPGAAEPSPVALATGAGGGASWPVVGVAEPTSVILTSGVGGCAS